MPDLSAFMTKLLGLLRAEVGEDRYKEIMYDSRAHAGGVAKAEKAKDTAQEAEPVQEPAAVAGSEGKSPFLALFSEPFELSDDTKTVKVQIFPRTGKYRHPSYGDLDITPEFLSQIKANFDSAVYQQNLPLTIDLEHQSKVSGAAGWIKDLDLRGEDGLWATIEVNERGAQLVREDAFRYFSPEYYDSWQDPASQAEYSNVLIGGALTNRPFFKGMQPIYVANEQTWVFTELSADTNSVTYVDLAPPEPETTAEPEPETAEEEIPVGMTEEEALKFTEMQDTLKALKEAAAAEKSAREAAEAKVSQLERENTRRELTEIVRNNRFAFQGEIPEVVAKLEKLQTALGPDLWAEYVAEKKATHAALSESELLKQRSQEGERGAIGGSFDSLVAAKMSEGLEKPAAIAAVIKENPKLYTEHVRTINRRAANPE